MYSIPVGEEWTIPELTAVDMHDVALTVNYHEHTLPDTTTPGTYNVEFYATDSYGHTTILIITVTVTPESQTYSAYYETLEGLTGIALKTQLANIISVMSHISYDNARYILDITDRDPNNANNANNVILVYNRDSVYGPWSTGGTTWNREHIWPQSLLGSASVSDLHNLKPANPSINSSRGNKSFMNKIGGGSYGAVGTGWYPGDDDKGDVARIVFYMNVRWDLDISLVGDLETLKQWHIDDPVDDFEVNRNDVIYSYQSNRNPFIDYPHLVAEIYGTVELSSGEIITVLIEIEQTDLSVFRKQKYNT